ncbi:MAG: hypothetical protein AVDCRST_MAG30-346, partial [uncultured Solirubrobacteraceae bacterium]
VLAPVPPPRAVRAPPARRVRRHDGLRPPGHRADRPARLHAQRRARGPLPGRRTRLRRRRGRAPEDPQARRLDGLDQAPEHGPRRPRDPRHPRPRDRARARHGRGGRHGGGAAAPGRGARAAVRAHPARPRGQARRGDRPAVGPRGAALRYPRRRRRPAPCPRDDDRLRGGQGPARPPGRRGDRLLERRGRRAARAPPWRPRVPRRRLRRAALPRARAGGHAHDARGPRGGGPSGHPGVAARLHRDAERPGVGDQRDARARAGARPRGAGGPARRRLPRLHGRRAGVRGPRPPPARRLGGLGRRVRDPEEAARRRAGIRHRARRARRGPV